MMNHQLNKTRWLLVQESTNCLKTSVTIHDADLADGRPGQLVNNSDQCPSGGQCLWLWLYCELYRVPLEGRCHRIINTLPFKWMWQRDLAP